MVNFVYLVGIARRPRGGGRLNPAYWRARARRHPWAVRRLAPQPTVLVTHYHTPTHVGGTSRLTIEGIAERLAAHDASTSRSTCIRSRRTALSCVTGASDPTVVLHSSATCLTSGGGADPMLIHTPRGTPPGSQCFFVEACCRGRHAVPRRAGGRPDLPAVTPPRLYEASLRSFGLGPTTRCCSRATCLRPAPYAPMGEVRRRI